MNSESITAGFGSFISENTLRHPEQGNTNFFSENNPTANVDARTLPRIVMEDPLCDSSSFSVNFSQIKTSDSPDV